MQTEYDAFLDALYRAPDARLVVKKTGSHKVQYTWHA